MRRDAMRCDASYLRELGLSISSLRLVSIAASHLIVSVDAAGHEKLLVLLWALGQRVSLALLACARHQELARALGRRAEQRRRLDLDEALLCAIVARSVNTQRGPRDGCEFVSEFVPS